MARKIAHEIKNPLTPIKLSIDRLKNKTNKGINISKSEVVETIDTINRQVDDIKSLVDEFSNFARMPAPNMHECNIKTIIENAISLFDLEKNKILIDYNKKSLGNVHVIWLKVVALDPLNHCMVPEQRIIKDNKEIKNK